MAHISNSEYHRLKSIEKTLQSIQEKEAMTPFVDSFLRGIGTMLALTPYKDWPPLARTSFEYYSKAMPTGAHLYKSKLPKEKL